MRFGQKVLRMTWKERFVQFSWKAHCFPGLKFSRKRENSAPSMKIVQNALFRSCAALFGQFAFLSVKVLKNRNLGLKFSSKRENSALSMKILQNALFRLCAARFGQILFLSAKVLKIVKLASNSLQSGKTVRFSWKLYNTLFSGYAQQVSAKSHFRASKFWKSSRGPEIPSKTRKQCAFHENCTRRSFQVMRISSKPKNSALSKKIVQNPLFMSCAARFGQIWFLSAKVLKILKLASNVRQNWKTVRFPWKLYKTLFSGHAQHVLAKSHFGASKFSKSWNWLQILFKAEKQCAFHENCTTRSFQGMRSRFWPNRILERQSSQNHHEGLKFSRKRENSAPSMKIVQDALFRSCAFLQNRKTVRFPRKL